MRFIPKLALLQQDDQSERRESGKNLSDSVTEQSDDSSATQDEPFDAYFAVYALHPSEVEKRELYRFIYIYIVGPQNAKRRGHKSCHDRKDH